MQAAAVKEAAAAAMEAATLAVPSAPLPPLEEEEAPSEPVDACAESGFMAECLVMRVAELRSALASRGLGASGNKAELAVRLAAAMGAEAEEEGSEGGAQGGKGAQGAPDAEADCDVAAVRARLALSTVVELREELRRLSLPESGRKAELVERLAQVRAAHIPRAAAATPPPTPTDTATIRSSLGAPNPEPISTHCNVKHRRLPYAPLWPFARSAAAARVSPAFRARRLGRR
eukprot:4514091-Pleurochrysis_carterae.AAC.1